MGKYFGQQAKRKKEAHLLTLDTHSVTKKSNICELIVRNMRAFVSIFTLANTNTYKTVFQWMIGHVHLSHATLLQPALQNTRLPKHSTPLDPDMEQYVLKERRRDS